jgi:hypothetical protein
VHMIETACHIAFYCPLTGAGRLVLPMPLDGPGTWESLHTSDGLDVLRRLAERGVEPSSDDETGDPWCTVGYRPDGREVVALYVLDPIITTPTVEELSDADRELDALAGLVRLPPVAPEQRRPEGVQVLDLPDGAA